MLAVVEHSGLQTPAKTLVIINSYNIMYSTGVAQVYINLGHHFLCE